MIYEIDYTFTFFTQSAIMIITNKLRNNLKGGERMAEEMSKEELMKISVEEFSRLQKWMLSVRDKDSETYNLMYERYVELKVILSNLSVNVTELDRIKA